MCIILKWFKINFSSRSIGNMTLLHDHFGAALYGVAHFGVDLFSANFMKFFFFLFSFRIFLIEKIILSVFLFYFYLSKAVEDFLFIFSKISFHST